MQTDFIISRMVLVLVEITGDCCFHVGGMTPPSPYIEFFVCDYVDAKMASVVKI